MKVLFYPDPPIQQSGHSLSKTIRYFQLFGAELTNDIDSDWDIAINWNYADIHRSPLDLARGKPVFNLKCNNVTKSYVDKVFISVFGYSSLADTTKYGYCVRKTDRQSAHDGKIIPIPCSKEKGYIYQLLLDNRCAINMVYDIRIPIFLGEIPLLFMKSRSIEGTFENSLSTRKNYWISNVESQLTKDEVEKVRKFCIKIGLDIGELDTIRDNSTGLLYIIDVNNIPGGAVFNHLKNGPEIEKQLSDFLFKQLYGEFSLAR